MGLDPLHMIDLYPVVVPGWFRGWVCMISVLLGAVPARGTRKVLIPSQDQHQPGATAWPPPGKTRLPLNGRGGLTGHGPDSDRTWWPADNAHSLPLIPSPPGHRLAQWAVSPVRTPRPVTRWAWPSAGSALSHSLVESDRCGVLRLTPVCPGCGLRAALEQPGRPPGGGEVFYWVSCVLCVGLSGGAGVPGIRVPWRAAWLAWPGEPLTLNLAPDVFDTHSPGLDI